MILNFHQICCIASFSPPFSLNSDLKSFRSALIAGVGVGEAIYCIPVDVADLQPAKIEAHRLEHGNKLILLCAYVLGIKFLPSLSFARSPPLSLSISILKFSRRLDDLFSAIEKTPFRISDPTLASRSDLRYVPTLRTFLHYKCFFYSEIPGAQAPV